MICIDKAQSYRRFIREINYRYDPHFDCIRHVDKKWLNNRIESNHAAMKRFLGYRQSFRSLRKVKVVLICIEICPVAAFLEPPPLKWSAPIVRKAEDLRWPLRDQSPKRLS
jgi:transposase-like protein